MSLRAWFIYTLADPRSDEIRYVGKTYTPHLRLLHHVSHSRKGVQHVNRWVNELRLEGLRPRMIVVESGGGDWEERERYWIAHFRAQGCPLTNTGAGGGFDVPPESRKRAGQKLRGRRPSPEVCARISAGKLGKHRADSAANIARCYAMAEANRGKKMNLSDAERERRREHMRLIPKVNHYDGMTAEERSAVVRKSWITRKAKRLA